MNPCMKLVRQLNLKEKEKIGDRGLTLSVSQESIKNVTKTSIPSPTELLCLSPDQNDY